MMKGGGTGNTIGGASTWFTVPQTSIESIMRGKMLTMYVAVENSQELWWEFGGLINQVEAVLTLQIT